LAPMVVGGAGGSTCETSHGGGTTPRRPWPCLRTESCVTYGRVGYGCVAVGPEHIREEPA
jgi:hypothetical protein